MAYSIELLPDNDTDAWVRRRWSALADVGLPSAQRVRSDTNRPHVTLLAARHIASAADAALGPAGQRLPMKCIIGAPVVFGHGSRHTLALLVVPSTELLSLHAQVARTVRGHTVDPDDTEAGAENPSTFAHVDPGAWTPHITLARRLTSAQVGEALVALESLGKPDRMCTFTALRRWDPDARTEHVVAGRAC
ncbi:2'-5' RNA ligase family protein [Gordonia alkanivorans]|uniref:2'-5' RNA ligase family protein n=1 Tax=Gordonia alkanivorans TaxID=84096 RepID=UPI0024B6A30A|nr:2'-5' RNA ligase family protein [Gordonia alkanivorans]MDJ0029175.1 2'-5' RNA ligase family protein [Gordonia alkanivorans]